MRKIKATSIFIFSIMISFTLFYTTINILDTYDNEFLIADRYSEFTEKHIDDDLLEVLIELNESDESFVLTFIHILMASFNIVIFTLLSILLFFFSKGEIYIKRNLNILKSIVLLYFIYTISAPVFEVLYVDIVNSLIHLGFEIRESFLEERIENIVFICILLIVSWIFLESINMKKNSDEYDMQKRFLIQQHKLSQLGQLLGFITHQWKDPINRISSYIVSMQISNADNEKLISKLDRCQQQIDHMHETMSSFKSFYKTETNENYFYFDKSVNYILELLKDDLLMNNISVDFQNNNKSKIKGSENEFSQVILILINNSKEVFKTRDILDKKISIIIDGNKIVYSDTAKGLKESVLKNIFLPEFTTKEESMGIGLYIAKLIIEEKFNANINVQNIKDGLKFTIKLPKEEKDV